MPLPTTVDTATACERDHALDLTRTYNDLREALEQAAENEAHRLVANALVRWCREAGPPDAELSESASSGSQCPVERWHTAQAERTSRVRSTLSAASTPRGMRDPLRAQALVAQVAALVEKGAIEEARGLIRQNASAPDELELVRWRRALLASAPVETGVATGSPIQEREWLRRHWRQYAGQWVALVGGAMLDAAASRAELRRRLSVRGSLRGVVFVHLSDTR